MADYQEFLDGIDRKAYHEGEWQWEEDGYTVTVFARIKIDTSLGGIPTFR